MASSPQIEAASSVPPLTRAKHTREELLAIFSAARKEIQAANVTGRDILSDFLSERRAAAERA